MKKILMMVVIMGMTGGAYAAGWSGAAQFSDQFGDLAVKAADLQASVAAEGVTVPAISRGDAAGNDSSAGAPAKPIEWVTINGGKFMMGNDDVGCGFEDTKSAHFWVGVSYAGDFENVWPSHEVTIKTFDISKTEVTVEQYAECVIKGQCTEPSASDYCTWGKPGRQLNPINCMGWDQANQYARFKGGRLPSEAEWEYAAKSGGKNHKYPWGNEKPTCDKAVMQGNGGYGCSKYSTMPVCSKPAGNTAQGLCDMAGNVWEWVQDKYQNSYKGAPADGSAFEGAGSLRVMRGGSSYNVSGASYLRTDSRRGEAPGVVCDAIGFRLVRSSR